MSTLTVSAGVNGDGQPTTVSRALAPLVAEVEAKLPPGYSIAVGGTAEGSAQSTAPILAVVPLMLFVMATILMLQLQSFPRLFLEIGRLGTRACSALAT